MIGSGHIHPELNAAGFVVLTVETKHRTDAGRGTGKSNATVKVDDPSN
jgi:hypothetical protein